MKRGIIKIIGLVMLTALTISCSKGADVMNETSVFPKGNKGPEQIFTGTTWVNMLVTDEDKVYDTQAYDVRFEAGARTYWHSHPGGQLLFITSGTGYYQEKGKPAQQLNPGDVVPISPDMVHWHGAAPDAEFVHLGVSAQVAKGPAAWFGPVTDEEYKEATAK